jgi:uncharacterized protein YkwD
MKYLKPTTLFILGLLLTSCGSSLSNANSNGTDAGTDVTLTGTLKSNELDANEKQTLLDAINLKRSSGFKCPVPVGARPAVNQLVRNDKLEQMALKHTNVLVSVNADFAKTDPHSGIGDGDIRTRAANVAYKYRAVGENIAGGQLNVTDVLDDWMASAGHCQNIMDGDFTQLGAAKLSTNGGAYATYWTLNFGTPQ